MISSQTSNHQSLDHPQDHSWQHLLHTSLAQSGYVFVELWEKEKENYPGVTVLPPPTSRAIDSAALLLVYLKDGKPHLLATQRPEHMRDFPGAVVFPGGHREAGETKRDTALREFAEELGTRLDDSAVCGELPTIYKTLPDGKCFKYTGYVAFSPELPALDINPDEVKRIIEIPLPALSELATADLAPDCPLEGATHFVCRAFLDSMKRALPLPSPLNIVVSAGGTRVPIDTVRNLSNDSGGTTGAEISKYALQRGHLVHYLYGKGAKTPFLEERTYDPAGEDVDDEIMRQALDAKRITPALRNSILDPVPTFDAYRGRVLELAANADYDVVIASMAASDYGPVPVDGKIGSDKKSLTIECEALPKIISEIKKDRGDIFLVGFKLLVDQPPDRLIEATYRNLLRDRQDLAVANVGHGSMKPRDMLTYIVTSERGVVPLERDALPETLMRLIEERYSKRYYSTTLEKAEKLPVPQEELDRFILDTRRIARLALFAPYKEEAREEFGFVAKRVERGTLITCRGSSKSEAGPEDLSVVTDVDPERRTLSVVSLGHKSSLNASVAHLILGCRPEINYIVHAHIPVAEAVSVTRDTSPATAEDWEYLEPLVKEGCNVIEQPHHGVLILLENLNDLFPMLERNSVYRTRAGHYDTAYHRFIGNARLTEIFSDEVPVEARCLDLAAGTGEVTKQLLTKGYSDITLVDIARPMLDVAYEKLAHVLPAERFVEASFQTLPFEAEFDAAIVRQAINYLPPGELVTGLRRIREALREDGVLLFNSFNPDSTKDRAFRFEREEVENRILLTTEGNLIEGDRIYHGQRTEMFDAFSGDYELIYDLNSFWLYSSSQFTAALEEAGFSQIKLITEKNSMYFVCRR